MILPSADHPTTLASTIGNTLSRRAYGYCVRYGHYGYYNTCKRSVWSRIGRWILAGILVFVGLMVLFITLCCLARRKRQSNRFQTNPAPNYQNGPHSYAPPPGAPPKYGGPEPYGGVTQPPNAYVQ